MGGGSDNLNLNNLAILQASVPYDKNSITLVLTVPISHPNNKGGGFATEGMVEFSSPPNNTYRFDIGDNKIQKIKIADKIFTVSLNKIVLLNIPNVAFPIQYEFGINED